MSHNQSRGDRSEYTQYRKTGRSGSSIQQRQFSGGASTKGGGGASSAPSNPSNRSFKKYNTNAQGGQSRERSPSSSSEFSNTHTAHALQNGVHHQQPTHGVPAAPVTSLSSNAKDAPSQKITRAVPRAPSSNAPTAAPSSSASTSSSEAKAPTTPAKAPGDASKSIPLQFGSISPGFMNGMQIPARTSSAPPNLDEQKRDQARHEAPRATPGKPVPSIPSQHLPKEDVRIPDQPSAGEAHQVSKSKRDIPVAGAPAQTQKPSIHSIQGMHMQMAFHQPQLPLPFGGPNPQIQSQPMSGMSLPMPMPMPVPIPIGNPQQPMFVSGLQPHPMQNQGMLHQGQSLNFPSQIAPQLPQLGNMGMHMAPQFPQQQAGKYSSSRKTVKITHPETHEELRLDGSSGQRSHPNVPAQSQPISSFPSHTMNIFPGSYNSAPLFFSGAGSVPLINAPVPPSSQPPRLYNQVTVKPPVGYGEKEQLPPTTYSIGKMDSGKPSRSHEEDSVRPQREVEPLSSSSLLKPGSGTSQGEVSNTLASASAPIDGSASASTCTITDELRHGVVLSDSSKDNKHQKPGNRGQPDQVGRQSSSVPPAKLPEAESVEAQNSLSGTDVVPETTKEAFTAAAAAAAAAASEASNLTSESLVEGNSVGVSKGASIKGLSSKLLKPETTGKKEKEKGISCQTSLPDKRRLENSLESISLDSPGITDKVETSDREEASTACGFVEQAQRKLKESSTCGPDGVTMADSAGGKITESSVSAVGLSTQEDKTSISDVSLSASDGISTMEERVTECAAVDKESAPVLVPTPHESAAQPETIGSGETGDSVAPPTVKDKVLPSEMDLAKIVAPKVKKKKKELYRKAEAAGTSSDLYNAYKGPQEKKETVITAEGTGITSGVVAKQKSVDVLQENAVPKDEPSQEKLEPDDWEDAAEISTPQLESSKNENQHFDVDGNGLMTKRYTRDFLLKFVEQCVELPEGFQITSNITDALMVYGANVPRDPHPSPGRNINKAGVGGSRLDRRGSALADEDKWSKLPGPLMPGRGDVRADTSYTGNISGFRPGQGGNYGVLRNPRAQTPLQYSGGILSGPMQSLGPQMALQRNNSDSDRWQRGSGFQKGLMPSPQTPAVVMHKAEKKYEVGKVTDDEEAKQRQLKGILNKLTPQNFEKLFQQVKQVNIDNVVTLSGVISQIFDKALMEPTFCEMYANFCFHLAADLPELSVNNERITFKGLLLNKCQEEFERGEREEEEANKVEEEGENKQTAEEREEKRLRARRRMLGNIRLIGELYKKKMLTERIMHGCINKLFGQYQNPDEENIEALCKLMSTIGEMIDHSKAKEHMDAYFDIMAQLSNNMKLSSRVRFMLKDAIDLRRNKWQQRRKVEVPKKIEEVHRDAAQERQAQASRLSRAPSMGSSVRRGPPMEFAPRTPNALSSPSSQMGSFRPVPPQLRGYGSQDARMDERPSYDNRTISVPLPQRPLGDDSITLGPQGGLARGMAFRGQPSVSSLVLGELHSPADARRIGPGLNGFGTMPERMGYGQRDDAAPGYMPERFAAPSMYDPSHPLDRSVNYSGRELRNTDRGYDRSLPSSPPARGPSATSMQNVTPEKVWPEDRLRDKSMSAIKEFYSARDEKEVALCIKELNSPSFHSSMISIWITDSFERKDVERDLLTKLLINLTKARDGMISEDQLVKGFESVLPVLEDAVNDAPRAAEFLGHIFSKVILEDVISLSAIGQLIYEGGEEQGGLVETGLAAEVLGWILDIIKSEKGDSVLNEIRSSSNLQLENFRPPGSSKSLRIDKFI